MRTSKSDQWTSNPLPCGFISTAAIYRAPVLVVVVVVVVAALVAALVVGLVVVLGVVLGAALHMSTGLHPPGATQGTSGVPVYPRPRSHAFALSAYAPVHSMLLTVSRTRPRDSFLSVSCRPRPISPFPHRVCRRN